MQDSGQKILKHFARVPSQDHRGRKWPLPPMLSDPLNIFAAPPPLGLSKADEHLAYTRLRSMPTFTLTFTLTKSD